MSALETIPGVLPCFVCRRRTARRRENEQGEFYGNACDGECHDLVKESELLTETGASEEAHAELLTRMQRRAADVNPSPPVCHGP